LLSALCTDSPFLIINLYGSVSYLHTLSRASAKEKKTRDQSGCLDSCEMSIYLQYSKGKEFALPVFQTHTLSSFPPSCDSYKIPLEFPRSKRGLTGLEFGTRTELSTIARLLRRPNDLILLYIRGWSHRLVRVRRWRTCPSSKWSE